MRAVLWDLLLLCLFARARGDCRGDCLHCDRHLYRDTFDVLICILECEGEAVPRATWELCAAAAAAGRAVPRPWDLRGVGDPWPGVAVPPLNPQQLPELQRRREREEEEEEEEEESETAPGSFPRPPEDISRRLGGFFRGPRGSRPGATARGVQKRYGGFIGVRKSARKWNNQKRFSEFLKQYLGMSPRSSEYELGGGIGEHNEI
ncbi:prepronociceptin isoform X2 [Heliangelus exortis]|uniref:prepronociceptin isoform X2 n=1 Tax=Heliangelus exortis TaxID=472823 RepID=UPI003A92242D